MSNDASSSVGIFDLPPEVLLEIFSFIDVKTLYQTVILTCKQFHEFLCVDGIWKALFGLKWKEHQIIDDLPYIDDWKNVCFSYEDINKHWTNREKKGVKLKSKQLTGHYGSVDAVHIPVSGCVCVSGSRDRTVLVWDIKSFIENDGEQTSANNVSVLQGHKGWVWTMDGDKNKENEIVTGSWDHTVRTWDLNTESCQNVYKYHPAAILDLCVHDNAYVTGCFDKTVRMFDPRSHSVVFQSLHHKRSVLCLQITDKFILSGSEDKTIGVYDRRAGKIFTTIRIDSTVLCMSMGHEQGFAYLRVGGMNGSFYMFDASNDRFTLLNSTQLWKKDKVTTLCNYRGCVVVGSLNGSVRAYTPDRKTKFLENLDTFKADVSSMHSRKDLLVAGRCDNSITLWNFCT